MKSFWKRFSTLLMCLMLLAFPFVSSAEEEEKVSLTELYQTYTTLDLTPYLGKTVLVNFFTEWCAYCMQEMPDIKKVSELYDEEHFQVILVHPWQNEDDSSTESVKARFGMEDMVFFEDKDHLVTSLIGVPGFPTSLFLDEEGCMVGAAPFMLTLEQLTMQLDAMGVPRKAAD